MYPHTDLNHLTETKIGSFLMGIYAYVICGAFLLAACQLIHKAYTLIRALF